MKRFVFRREELPATEITKKEIESKINNDVNRRINFLNRKKIMHDNLHGIIDNQLRLMFSEESYQDMKQYIDVSSNLARRVLKEISSVYSESPQRVVSPKANDKRYQEITGSEMGFDINQKMSRANFLLNGLNDLIFQAAQVGDVIDFHTYTPDMVTVFENPDNPTVLDAILIEDFYYDDKGEKQEQWIFWSPTRHFVIDKDMEIRHVVGNEEMVSPFRDINIVTGKFYPFLDVHNSSRENCFWDTTTGTDLFEGTKLIALQNTFRNFMIPMQFKQIAVQVTGVDENRKITKSNQIKSPLHVFESNGQISVLDWQSNILQLGESIQNTMFGVAGNYGISQENFKLTTQAQSGFARMVAKERLNELREEQKKVWRNAESGVFDLVRAVNNLYGVKPISDSAKFSVDFADASNPQDPLEEIQVIKQRLELGVINLLQVIKQSNPDIETDEEAEEFLKKNIEIRNSLKAKYNLDFTFLDNKGDSNGQGNSQAGTRFANFAS